MSSTLTNTAFLAATTARRADVRPDPRCGIITNMMRSRIVYGIMEGNNREIRMDEKQAKVLGQLLREKRQELGMSTREVSQATGFDQTTVVRLEQGQYLNPDPDKLRAIAAALDLNLADVLEMADYPIPTELPSMGPYLRTKYRDLPADAIDEVHAQVAHVLKKHGIEPNDGPRDGEDELPEDGRPGA